MNLDNLRIFYYAAKARSYTNSALNLSPSVMSRHVSALEHQHQVQLFYRHCRKLILTPQGQVLFEGMQKIMQEIDRMHCQLREQFPTAETPENTEKNNCFWKAEASFRLFAPSQEPDSAGA